MTMMFRTVKASVQALLAAYSTTGLYRVLGYNDDAIGADDLNGVRRLVQVYADSGDFLKNSSFLGPIKHEVVFAIDLTTAAKAQVDLSVLEDPDASAAQLIAALAAEQKASEVADADLDEFVDVIFNLLMSNENTNMGIDPTVASVSNRWIPKWKKSKPMARGEAVVLTATLDLNLRLVEYVTGVTPVAPTVGQAVKSRLQIATDESGEPGEELAGVLVGG